MGEGETEFSQARKTEKEKANITGVNFHRKNSRKLTHLHQLKIREKRACFGKRREERGDCFYFKELFIKEN